MRLERLEYFVALAKELHFGRAARRLHISQPALSQQIRTLERHLGTSVCTRTARGVELTQAGKLLLERATALLGDYQHLIDQVRTAGQAADGTLRIWYTRSAAELCSHHLITTFRDRYPSITVHTATAWTSLNLTQLDGGTIDAAFVRTPLSASGTDLLPLATSELVAVVPEGQLPATTNGTIHPDQLFEQPFIFWPRDQAPQWHDDVFTQLWGTKRPHRLIEEPDGEHILAAVAAGRGTSVLDHHRAHRLRRPGVLIRHFTVPVPTAGLALAWKHHRTLSPPLQHLIDHCRQETTQQNISHETLPQ